MDKMSSEKSTTESDVLFSFKRYFVNNVDSYQGEYILREVSKVVEKNVRESVKESTHSLMGEDAVITGSVPIEHPYEIIGTVSEPKTKSVDNVSKIVPKSECLPVLLTCGTVILDISYDKEEVTIAMEYLKLLKALLEKQAPTESLAGTDDGGAGESKKRYLILISTVMTWASTKPLDPDSTDIPFIETDFRKRKPHPNYKTYYDVENEVIGIARKFRSQIGATVVASGVTYGGREDVLFYWFQKAWECERLLPIFGRGGNTVPLINVQDLAQIVFNLMVDFPKKLYILAVEQNITKQRQIIKPLGRIVGSGMFKCIPPEDAFLIPEINQRIYDLMTLNLNMEPSFIVETMGLQWVSESSFTENVPTLMKAFRKERALKPFKVIVYGPPIVGKTTLSKLISDAYGLMYISPETVVDDIIDDLTWRIHHWEEGEFAALATAPQTGEEEDPAPADSEDDQVEEEGAQETARQTLASLLAGRVPTEEELIGYLRQRLLCHEARNKGWVLDGFPVTLGQCSMLFDKGDEQDSDVEEENNEEQFDEDVELYSNVLKKILPDIVVSLEATDDFVCDKAMRDQNNDSRLDEEVVLKRLNEFRTNDGRDVSPLNFFDELDIHPLIVPVKDNTDYSMKASYAAVALRMGRPCRYGKLMDRIEAAEKKERKELEAMRVKEEKALKELEKMMQEEREDKMEYWAEYLFKLNPTGKMLEPGYNLQAEKLLGKIKILDDALKDLDIKIDPLLPPECEVEDPKPHTINPMSAL
ncbi:adenylate kinase 7-like isoform X2 [Leptidea sinapis]|nr:adenylate kinase 7-like isoform X2 [Leptidea sinapis]